MTGATINGNPYVGRNPALELGEQRLNAVDVRGEALGLLALEADSPEAVRRLVRFVIGDLTGVLFFFESLFLQGGLFLGVIDDVVGVGPAEAAYVAWIVGEDPGFAAEVPPLPDQAAAGDDGRRRWDGQDLRAFTGTYGDYLLGKVSKVFPSLRDQAL